jgi:hypothetical protein
VAGGSGDQAVGGAQAVVLEPRIAVVGERGELVEGRPAVAAQAAVEQQQVRRDQREGQRRPAPTIRLRGGRDQ